MTEQTGWVKAIDEALVVHHIGIADPTDDYETAKRKLNVLLCVAQQIGEDFGKQALNLPEQEPVAWMLTGSHEVFHAADFEPDAEGNQNGEWTPLYTAPTPRRPLTDEMVKRMKEVCTSMEMRGAFADGWLSAEAAHGITGETK